MAYNGQQFTCKLQKLLLWLCRTYMYDPGIDGLNPKRPKSEVAAFLFVRDAHALEQIAIR